MQIRSLLPLPLVFVLAACASGPPPEPDISGEYEIRTTVQGSNVTATMFLQKGEAGYSGDIETDGAGSFAVSAVTQEGDVWVIRSDTVDGMLIIEMYIEGDAIRGSWSMAGDGGTFTGRRLGN